MMNGYLLHGQPEEAIAAFRQLKIEKFQPNIVTFVNILHVVAQLTALRVGISVQAFGYCSHTLIGNILVDMYVMCGVIESSERCFIEIKKQRHGFYVSFLSVLSACRHAGLVEEGKHMFKETEKRHKIEAEVKHYACMVDLLGKSDLYGEVISLCFAWD